MPGPSREGAFGRSLTPIRGAGHRSRITRNVTIAVGRHAAGAPTADLPTCPFRSQRCPHPMPEEGQHCGGPGGPAAAHSLPPGAASPSRQGRGCVTAEAAPCCWQPSCTTRFRLLHFAECQSASRSEQRLPLGAALPHEPAEAATRRGQHPA